MKIVEIIPSLNVEGGGAEIFFDSLCKEFSTRKNTTIEVICLYDGVAAKFDNLLANDDIKIHFLSKKVGFDLKCSRRLKKLLDQIQPDIVHYHLGVTNVYFFSQFLKKPKWKTYCTVHSVPDKDEKKINHFLRKLLLKSNKLELIGVSPHIAEETKKFYSLNECKFVFNGCNRIDVNANAEKEYDFVCVAVFKPAKNHKLLFDAFKRVQIENANVRLLCVGGGELLEHYKNYVKENDINNIEFLGWANDVPSALQKSKVFVLSSLYEGNPVSIIEAMQCGLPVIAPSVGGIPDVVKNNVNGLLFESQNCDELYNSMKMLITNDQLSKTMSINNFNDAKKYTIDTTVDEYQKIFNEGVEYDKKSSKKN